jgi:hypothetical protein
MKSTNPITALAVTVLVLTGGLLAEEAQVITKGAVGKGDVSFQATSDQFESYRTKYEIEFEVTGRDEDAFTAVIRDPGTRYRPAMVARINGALGDKQGLTMEVVEIQKGQWFKEVPKKLTGKLMGTRVRCEWSENDPPKQSFGYFQVTLHPRN